jgi:hypothetical protein
MKADYPIERAPATPLESFLQEWPEVFLGRVSRLGLGGLPFTYEGKVFGRLIALVGH